MLRFFAARHLKVFVCGPSPSMQPKVLRLSWRKDFRSRISPGHAVCREEAFEAYRRSRPYVPWLCSGLILCSCLGPNCTSCAWVQIHALVGAGVMEADIREVRAGRAARRRAAVSILSRLGIPLCFPSLASLPVDAFRDAGAGNISACSTKRTGVECKLGGGMERMSALKRSLSRCWS